MRVAILGDGLLARSIMDVYAANEPPGGYAVMLGHADVEITSMDSLVRAFAPHQPDVVINTVAMHRLKDCEMDPMLARLVNEIGAGRVASLYPTIYVSTDYVFNDKGPHEEDVPGERPRSVYGQTKMGGELATLEHNGIVVRVSGLYHHKHKSHKGPSFPDVVTTGFDPMRLPNDQRFSPTYAPDAAERIVELAQGLAHVCDPDAAPCRERAPEGIYHAANRGSTTWAEFAQHIVEVTRHKRTITGYAAHDRLRPTDSTLKSKRLPPLEHWANALNRWSVAREFIPRVSPLRAK